MDYTENTRIFKALADETRLRIVEILSCGELCACDILDSFDFSQPTLSYHMKILVESGLVLARKDGSWMRYRLDADKIAKVSAYWTTITSGDASCICHDNRNDARDNTHHEALQDARDNTHHDALHEVCNETRQDSSVAKSTTNREGNAICAL